MANKFSVIIPTYTGVETIGYLLDSIYRQSDKSSGYEVVIVIDGPNQQILDLVSKLKQQFLDRQIPFTIHQHQTNKGRFEARLTGAKLAKYDTLLFVDDRVRLSVDFFKAMGKLDAQSIMPDIIEKNSHQNLISFTIFNIRRKLYRLTGQQSQKDYYVTPANFEKSPKGTTTLIIDKTIFIDACRKLAKIFKSDSRSVSDDTKLLREVIKSGKGMLRTNQLKVYYYPRTNFVAALKHLFQRGPKFIDYYWRPGTRFFPFLIVLYLLIIAIVVIAIIKPVWLYDLLAITAGSVVLAAFYLAKNLRDFIKLILGCSVVLITFTAGILKGTFWKIAGR